MSRRPMAPGRTIYRSEAELHAALATMQLSGVVHLVVLHDDDRGCSAAACYCSPWYAIEPAGDRKRDVAIFAESIRWRRGRQS